MNIKEETYRNVVRELCIYKYTKDKLTTEERARNIIKIVRNSVYGEEVFWSSLGMGLLLFFTFAGISLVVMAKGFLG